MVSIPTSNGPTVSEKVRGLGWKRNVAYACITVLAFFGVMEAALRLGGFRFSASPIEMKVNAETVGRAFRQAAKRQTLPAYQPEGRYKHSETMIWEPVAGEAPFNRQGLLGPELPRERSGGLRVACLGDSCTQLGSPPYPVLLRDLLSRERQEKVEVLNAGVIGYTTYQGLLRLERDVLPYRPDVVIIYFGWNDHWSIYTAPDPQLARDRREPSLGWVDYVGGSRVVQAALWAAVELRRSRAEDPGARDANQYVLRVPPVDYRTNLREMIALCRSREAVPVLVTAPTSLGSGPTPPGLEEVMAGEASRQFDSLPAMHLAYVRATREVAEETSVTLVDAYAAFGDGKGLIQRDYIHLRPEGAQRMAELLAEAVDAAMR